MNINQLVSVKDKPAQGESLSSLMACRSHLFFALCCGTTGGVTSTTSVGGVLRVTRFDFLGGRLRSRPGVLGGEERAASSSGSMSCPLRSPIMVEATRTRFSRDGADTSAGLYGDRYGDGVRSGERPSHSVAMVFLVLGSLNADSTEPSAASTRTQVELTPRF